MKYFVHKNWILVLAPKVISFTQKIKKIPTLTDYMIILAIAFGTVGFGHFAASYLAEFFNEAVANINSEIANSD